MSQQSWEWHCSLICCFHSNPHFTVILSQWIVVELYKLSPSVYIYIYISVLQVQRFLGCTAHLSCVDGVSRRGLPLAQCSSWEAWNFHCSSVLEDVRFAVFKNILCVTVNAWSRRPVCVYIYIYVHFRERYQKCWSKKNQQSVLKIQ